MPHGCDISGIKYTVKNVVIDPQNAMHAAFSINDYLQFPLDSGDY